MTMLLNHLLYSTDPKGMMRPNLYGFDRNAPLDEKPPDLTGRIFS
jgi:hypothetical protein